MSIFDPNTFGSMTFTDSNSTETVPCPPGEWPATVDSKKIETWQKKDGSASGLKISVMWAITEPAVIELVGRAKVIVRQELMLDLTETGGLDFSKGMNVGLGRLRAGLGLNTPGEPFTFDMLVGRHAKIAVSHRAYEDKLIAEVKGVAAL